MSHGFSKEKVKKGIPKMDPRAEIPPMRLTFREVDEVPGGSCSHRQPDCCWSDLIEEFLRSGARFAEVLSGDGHQLTPDQAGYANAGIKLGIRKLSVGVYVYARDGRIFMENTGRR